MPLVKANLKSDFRAVFDSKPKDRSELAQRWAAAYDSYASLAITGNGGNIIAAGKKSVLEATLLGVLSIPIGVPAVVAAAWGAGLLAYWGGTPFTPGVVPNPPFTLPGVAVPPVGIAALIPALTAIYLKTDSEDGFADAQATALDICTKTVLVLFGAVPQPVQ
jgi:hypothetical protein